MTNRSDAGGVDDDSIRAEANAYAVQALAYIEETVLTPEACRLLGWSHREAILTTMADHFETALRRLP